MFESVPWTRRQKKHPLYIIPDVGPTLRPTPTFGSKSEMRKYHPLVNIICVVVDQFSDDR